MLYTNVRDAEEALRIRAEERREQLKQELREINRSYAVSARPALTKAMRKRHIVNRYVRDLTRLTMSDFSA